MTTYYPVNHRGAIYPRKKVKSLRDQIARVIYNTKYPDSEFEKLHPKRLMRKERIKEADAVIAFLNKKGIINVYS